MKKITLFTLLTLLLCTSCVTKKKFMQAEMAATISKDSLQGLLTDCRNINAQMSAQIKNLLRDTTKMGNSIRQYQSMLNVNMTEQEKLNALLSQKKNELNERERTINELQDMIKAQNDKVQNLLSNVKDALLGFSTDELDFGSYKVLTVGSLSDRFRLSDNAGNKLVPGTTTLQQVIVSLKRETDVVNFEFQHLYFGEVVEVDHLPSNTNHKIYPVNLIRDTNRFNLALMGYEENKVDGTQYTFEIQAPENAVYSWENEPTGQGPVTYVPYYTGPGEISDVVMSARLNTMRLLNRSGWDYKFIIRDANTEAEVWSYNLMTLLSIARPVSRYDGTELPFQEYLDRQSEWNLIFTVVEKPGGGFLQIGIVVGTWIHWLHGMEV